jgi:carbon-monoxide dehydrogenase large subunit
LPYPNAVGVTFDTASHIECLDRALAMSDFNEFRRTRSGRDEGDGKLRGIGLACIIEHTGQGSSRMRQRGQAAAGTPGGSPGFDAASLRMEPDGKVVGYVSHATQGQGHATVFAQLAADRLGIELDDVIVEEGDTALAPFGTGTAASRGAVSGGGAVIRAAEKIAAKLRRLAAFVLEASADNIVLADNKASLASDSTRSVSIMELARLAYSLSAGRLPQGEDFGLEAIDYYDPPTSSYSNAVHVASVAIDTASALVTVERYCVVHDCGRVINPMIVDGQVQGGIAQGLGEALMEAVSYSADGQLQTTTLLDYVIPTALDVPYIAVDHVETPSTTTVGGIKGAGEGGVVGAVPAIALAVADALRTYNPAITQVPLTPSVILDLMNRASTQIDDNRAKGKVA